MSEREINIKIKTIRSGQPRRYADSEYEYELEVTGLMSGRDVETYCTKILRPCSQKFTDWKQDSADSYFAGYYTFAKLGGGRYKYHVREPYTG